MLSVHLIWNYMSTTCGDYDYDKVKHSIMCGQIHVAMQRHRNALS